MPLKPECWSPDEIVSSKQDNKERATHNLSSCLVCGDVSTGKHYGATACNGCKGFFRRSIRKGHKYKCRFDKNCQINKHNRAICRSCRFSRCLMAGMKVEAVQNERDQIGKRTRTDSNSVSLSQNTINPISSSPQSICTSSLSPVDVGSAPSTLFYGVDQQSTNDPNIPSTSRLPKLTDNIDPWDNPKLLIDLLMKSEEKIKSLRASVVRETGKFEYTVKHEPPNLDTSGRKATYNDILHSLHSQLLLVIEWAKTLKPFSELCTEDQTALLKNFASQHIVLCVAYRSINSSGCLQLINDTCIPRIGDGAEDDFYRKDCERVMDHLVGPMQFLGMDSQEFVALKACVLFNPVARGLSNENVMKVLDTRRRIFASLEHHVRTKRPMDPNRIGDLTFFILSPLQSLAKSISEDVLVTKLSGMARVDLLMEELILEETEPKSKNGIDLRRSLSENNDQVALPVDTRSSEALTELHTMQIPITRPRQNTIPVAAVSPVQYALSTNMPTTSSATEFSPLQYYETMSTLASYVSGNIFQSPLSPSSDVMFSSTTTVSTMPINTGVQGKLSSCSTTLDPVSPCQQQIWATSTQPYEYTNPYQAPVTSSNVYNSSAPPPMNY